jgi:hypothetical protein
MMGKPTNLEPAVGRLLVVADGSTWTIREVRPDGSLTLEDSFSPDVIIDPATYKPEDGEWIAADMESLRAYARLIGLELI